MLKKNDVVIAVSNAQARIGKNNVHFNKPPVHSQGRPGDVLHSQADIGKAERNLNYAPVYSLQQGLDMTVLWYIENHGLPIVAGHAARKLHAAWSI